MNNARRKELKIIVGDLQQISSRLNIVHDAEEDCYNNIPDNLLESERSVEMQNAIDSLENAIEHIDDSIDDITSAL